MSDILFALIVLVTVLIMWFILVTWKGKTLSLVEKLADYEPSFKQPSGSTCTSTTCSNNKDIDPVSDPAYNMKQIAMQSILLEDHLTDKKKRCKDCICKHFMSMIAYATEGVSLAMDRIEQYPYLRDAPKYYQGLFDAWLKAKDDDSQMMHTADQLRDMRKKIVAKYYLDE